MSIKLLVIDIIVSSAVLLHVM